jgi:hypothetical protein
MSVSGGLDTTFIAVMLDGISAHIAIAARIPESLVIFHQKNKRVLLLILTNISVGKNPHWRYVNV